MTQFLMAGVKTVATVQVLDEGKFGFVLHLSDPYEGGEMIPADEDRDGVIQQTEGGRWEIIGESKVSLSPEDLQNLGAAIEEDFLKT